MTPRSLTPDQRRAILESLRAGVPIDAACKAVRATVASARATARTDADFADDLAEAESGATPPTSAVAPPSPPAPAPEPPRHLADLLRDAARLGPGLTGALLAVERRCVDAGLHSMDPHWERHFTDFYASGKMIDVGRFGVRAAKSDSTCRAITAESLLLQRILEPSIVGVCPVMSANMREASDRFDTVTSILAACGLRNLTGKRVEEDDGFKTMGGGSSALVIALRDSQGHPIEFRIYPASVAGAAGFTGIAGFGDELDLWGGSTGANPAPRVIEVLVTRYTTQPEAKLHLMSASYDRQSEHAAMIARGDTPRQRVARLGVEGAAKDTADRRRLAALIQSTDPLLLTPADPLSTDIPAWVTNPIAPIEDCYKKIDGNLRRMFALYGGRPEFADGAAGGADQLTGLADANRRLSAAGGAERGGLTVWPGLPAWDPRSGARGRGKAVL